MFGVIFNSKLAEFLDAIEESQLDLQILQDLFSVFFHELVHLVEGLAQFLSAFVCLKLFARKVAPTDPLKCDCLLFVRYLTDVSDSALLLLSPPPPLQH